MIWELKAFLHSSVDFSVTKHSNLILAKELCMLCRCTVQHSVPPGLQLSSHITPRHKMLVLMCTGLSLLSCFIHYWCGCKFASSGYEDYKYKTSFSPVSELNTTSLSVLLILKDTSFCFSFGSMISFCNYMLLRDMSWCLSGYHDVRYGHCRWLEVLGSVTSHSAFRHTVNGSASLPRSPKPPTPPPRYVS